MFSITSHKFSKKYAIRARARKNVDKKIQSHIADRNVILNFEPPLVLQAKYRPDRHLKTNSTMILIADSGSTKTDWAALTESEGSLFWSGPGYNPNFISLDSFRSGVMENLPSRIDPSEVEAVHFYGAGVGSPKDRDSLIEALRCLFPKAEALSAESDLLGAARSLLGSTPGFAAILGTGMNTCLYDGENITMKIPPLGFILGDEGSGAYIGRMLLRDYARGNMPADVYEEVSLLVGKTTGEIIAEVYRKPSPNRYCATFAKWVGERRHDSSYCNALLKTAFREFFRGVVCLYPDYAAYSLNCVGSVAYACQDILSEVASEFGMTLGKVLKSPIEGLVKFHHNF